LDILKFNLLIKVAKRMARNRALLQKEPLEEKGSACTYKQKEALAKTFSSIHPKQKTEKTEIFLKEGDIPPSKFLFTESGLASHSTNLVDDIPFADNT
jgi:hypothetical protein